MKLSANIRWSLGVLTMLYLALPLVIFFVGWLRPVVAVLAVVPFLFCGWQLLRAWPKEAEAFRGGETAGLAIFALAWTALAGIGGYAPQTTDWIKHNAVLYDCIHLPWPVVVTDGQTHWPVVYYVAYYLPAAVAGKVAGYAVAQAVLWVWSAAGVMLTCFWFARLTRLPAWVAAIAFFLFSGPDFVMNLVVQVLGLAAKDGGWHFYPDPWWSRIWQFAPHQVMLLFAPGQALVGWLAAGLLLSCPRALRPLGFGFLFVCALLWSPFAAAGLGLVALLLVGREGWVRPVRPLAPLTGLILPGGVLAIYYAAKSAPEIAARFPTIAVGWFTRFHDAPDGLKCLVLLGLFVVFEFGLMLWFIRSAFPSGSENRRLAEVTGLALICLLPVTAGFNNDLALRASAVPWFCLAILAVRTCLSTSLSPGRRRWFWVFIVICALTPVINVVHQGYHLVTRKYDPRTVPHQVSALVNMRDGGFDFFGAPYVGGTNSFFTRHLAR